MWLSNIINKLSVALLTMHRVAVNRYIIGRVNRRVWAIKGSEPAVYDWVVTMLCDVLGGRVSPVWAIEAIHGHQRDEN